MSKPSLGDYLWAAFNARPLGMFVPPNWIALGAIGILGLINPGLWILGAGLELGYLYTLVTHPRFRRTVEGEALLAQRREQRDRQMGLIRKLSSTARDKYAALESRCRAILEQQRSIHGMAELETQSQGLGRLMWIYLRLLLTRMSLQRLINEATLGQSGDVDQRITELEATLADTTLNGDLRNSYNGQLDILRQRKLRQGEARQRLSFVDSELTRIEEQVELIREQAIVSAEAGMVSERIDQISATLGSTTQWMGDQQQIFSEVEDLLVDPPPIVMHDEPQKETA